MAEEAAESVCRALAWPGFVPPPPRNEDPAGIAHEVRCLRDRLLLGADDGAWLPPHILRKVRWEDSDDDDDGGDGTEVGEAEQWMDAEDEAYWKYLRKLDPSSWKDQDHYRVLGLRRLRFSATQEQIRLAYRAKVVYHHPDKRRQRGEEVKGDGNEDYFTCITRAHETLSHRHRRRAYDSVDPHFKDSTPSLEEAKKQKSNFFGLFRPCFDNNARWSTVQPVPSLGDAKTARETVEEFYSFWFEFTSWREFSYLDEEDKDKGENREERRWIERQNKSERDRRRKEETKRIRTLVETAYAVDPRIAAFREEERRAKAEEKERRKEALRKRKEVEAAVKAARDAEEAAAKAAADEADKRRREEERKEKLASKKERTRQRKLLETFCREADYFEADEAARMDRMEELTKLTSLLTIDEMRTLNAKLRGPNGQSSREAFLAAGRGLEERLASETEASKTRASDVKRQEEEERQAQATTWTTDELQLLIKAASAVYPVGTRSRYENIANYINEHRKDKSKRDKTAKDVIAKSKEMSQEMGEGEAAQEVKAAAAIVGAKKAREVEATGGLTEVTEGERTVQWSAEEQKALEAALRSVPPAAADRWDQIAANVPGKTRQDCVKRFKELAELVKAKRAAAQADALKKLNK